MPANLTPDYQKAEQRYREAATDEGKLAALQEMLSTIPKHKGTEKMQADIKRRISLLRKETARKSAGRGQDLFYVPKNGAGQVVLVGLPNVGKSSLVAATTNAPVKIGQYPFTTSVPVPGMWQHEDVQIQLVDTPPVTPEHVPGGLFATVRQADAIAIVVDGGADPLEETDAVIAILAARNVLPVTVPRHQLDARQSGQRSGLIVANKADRTAAETIAALRDLYAGRLDVLPTSAVTGQGLDHLRRRLWELLGVIRVYTKEPGRPPDNDRPYTLPAGATVADLAREIHRELPEVMKFARIWGSGRLDGQRAPRHEVLRDKDVVEIHQ